MQNQVDWDNYSKERFLERNRLTLDHHRGVLTEFIDFFKDLDIDSRIIDLACGGGLFLEILRDLGFKNIEGIDISQIHVQRACGKNLNVCCEDLLKMNFNAEYDCALCMDILEHLETAPWDIINKALKPEGILFVTVPVYDSFLHRWQRARWRIKKLWQAQKHDPTHIKAYSKALLENEIEQEGFKLVYSKHIFNPVPFSQWKMKKVGELFNCGMFLVAVFRKKK